MNWYNELNTIACEYFKSRRSFEDYDLLQAFKDVFHPDREHKPFYKSLDGEWDWEGKRKIAIIISR